MQTGPGGPPPQQVGAINRGLSSAARMTTDEFGEMLSRQSQEGRALYESQMETVERLQLELARGNITEEEYFDATERMFETQQELLFQHFAEQGRPVRSPFEPEPEGVEPPPEEALPPGRPEGVQFAAEPQRPQQLRDEDDQLVYGGPQPSFGRPSTVGLAPPEKLYDWLEALIELVQQPDAPPQLMLLLRSIMSNLGA